MEQSGSANGSSYHESNPEIIEIANEIIEYFKADNYLEIKQIFGKLTDQEKDRTNKYILFDYFLNKPGFDFIKVRNMLAVLIGIDPQALDISRLGKNIYKMLQLLSQFLQLHPEAANFIIKERINVDKASPKDMVAYGLFDPLLRMINYYFNALAHRTDTTYAKNNLIRLINYLMIINLNTKIVSKIKASLIGNAAIKGELIDLLKVKNEN